MDPLRITRIDPEGIHPDTLIAEELGIDSLLTIEIIANVESHFGIELDEAQLVGVSTVGDFVAIIRSQAGSSGRPGLPPRSTKSTPSSSSRSRTSASSPSWASSTWSCSALEPSGPSPLAHASPAEPALRHDLDRPIRARR